MAWLAIHMWLLLLGAFLIGLLLGWWIWHRERIIERTVTVTGPDTGDGRGATTTMGLSGASSEQASDGPQKPEQAGIKPILYASASEGPADDLKKVKGIGPQLEGLLHSLGIFYFRQIADWTPDHVAWIDTKLQFPGRIDRENWVAQAKVLRDGGETEFAQRYEKGETPSSYKKGEGEID